MPTEKSGNPQEKPNIIWIQTDQHNLNVMGAYGDPIVLTPNLDSLASRGSLIRGAYCASPICVPSRMSLITGMYPHETEVWTNDQMLNSSIPTVAHALGAAGYKPIQIGRMHFNGVDQKHGFSERLVGDHGPNYPGSPRTVSHGILSGTTGPDRTSLVKSGKGQNAYQIHDELVAQTAASYIDRLGSEKRAGRLDQPIFLSIGLMLPHQPFVAQSQDFDRYVGKVDLPEIPPDRIESCHPYIRWWRDRTGITTVNEEEVLRARVAYWALCDRTDQIIGNILDSLRSNGFIQDSLIIYTSDHGEQLGQHGLWWKQTFYENSALVPALIVWPGHIPENQMLDKVINQFDLTSTVLDAAGSPDLPRSHGRSMLDMLNKKGDGWEDIAFSEYCMNDSDYGRTYSPNLGGGDVHAKPGGVQNRMIRYGPWKLNYYHGYDPQLFNLQEDPLEMLDRNKDPGCSAIRAELLDRILDGWNPDIVHDRMRLLKEEQIITEDWAHNVDPADELRWEFDEALDQLCGQ